MSDSKGAAIDEIFDGYVAISSRPKLHAEILAWRDKQIGAALEEAQSTLELWYQTSKNHPLEDMNEFANKMFEARLSQLGAKDE